MKTLFLVDDYTIDPLGTAWLSSYLKDAGHEVRLHKTKYNHTFSVIEEYQPDILCYSTTTGKHTYYRDLNNRIRATYEALSVFGGPHPTLFPKYAMEDGVDVAVMGEGYDAIVDIANACEIGGTMANIPNVVIKDKINAVRPLKDKHNLLHPDRELIYSYPENYNNPIKNIMASFFCPYNCPYCGNYKYKEMYRIKKAQLRPVSDVAEEALELKDYPLELIFFQDDIFPIYNKGWIDMFCKQYPQVNVPFHIQTRVEFINNDIIRQLKEVGLHSVTFAIESGNSRLRWSVLERKMSDKIILKGAEILHKYGIKFRTENMIGIPEETMETALETLDLNIECNPTIAWASLFQPYPGTKLGERCLRDGSYDGNMENLSESFFGDYVIKNESAKQFNKLQKLFSFVVKHKWLRPFIKPLMLLPFNYRKLYQKTKVKLYKQLYMVEKC